MSDICTYYIGAQDSDSAVRHVWREHAAARPGSLRVVLKPDDIPALWRNAYGRVFRVRVGVSREPGRPVPVSEAEEVSQ